MENQSPAPILDELLKSKLNAAWPGRPATNVIAALDDDVVVAELISVATAPNPENAAAGGAVEIVTVNSREGSRMPRSSAVSAPIMIAEAIHNENLDCGFFSVCSRRPSAEKETPVRERISRRPTSFPGKCHSVPCGSIAENLARIIPSDGTSSEDLVKLKSTILCWRASARSCAIQYWSVRE